AHEVDWNPVRGDSFLSASWDDSLKFRALFRELSYCSLRRARSPRHADVFASASNDLARLHPPPPCPRPRESPLRLEQSTPSTALIVRYDSRSESTRVCWSRNEFDMSGHTDGPQSDASSCLLDFHFL
ncbi:hypothetical protein B296_00045703, partial [Ensete ventricosum]